MQEIVKMVDVNHDGKIQFEGMALDLTDWQSPVFSQQANTAQHHRVPYLR